MADQQFCLRWNNHQSTLISVFDSLLENGTLVDCTLAAEGKYLKAHKVVLSACSPYLETLLSQHYEKHPIVILKDVKFTELKSMMDYMYRGEVNISQDQLGTFLKAAESLQIKGLSDNGSDGDGRDVGSTSKGPPPRKTQPAASTRPVESQRPDLAPASPAHRSRDGSISPSSRKRRRTRRNSQDDDANMGDSHLDSNSCDLPSQAQSTPIVPNIPAAVTSSITTTPIKTIVKPEQTELVVNRIDTSNLNSLPPESGLLKEKIEPISEPLLEPKTEYLDDANNDDSVEDLTLDDDDEMDEMDMSNMSNMSNISRPGPSHGNDVSNQGFVPWQMANQSGTDEVFMAAQEAVQAHRGDSQGKSQEQEVVRRRSNRARTVSGHYVSVECRPRISKHRRRHKKFMFTEIKEEPEDKPMIDSTEQSSNLTTQVVQKTPQTDVAKTTKKTRGRPKKCYPTRIKIEPETEPSTSGYCQSDQLPSLEDDLLLIQQSIKAEPPSTPKKRGKKCSFPVSQAHKCEFCGRVYKYRKGMLQHQRLECGQEPQFPCPYCPVKFRYRHQIRNHVFSDHNQAFNRWYTLFYAASKLPRWPHKDSP